MSGQTWYEPYVRSLAKHSPAVAEIIDELDTLRAQVARVQALHRQVIDDSWPAPGDQIAQWRVTEHAERSVLSSLLRGMARRVGTLRGNGRHITAIVDDMQQRLHTALNERDEFQTQLSGLDSLRRNHDALADAYVATREALDHTRARVTAIRELHQPDDDGNCVECDGYDGKNGGRKVEWPCPTVVALGDSNPPLSINHDYGVQ